MKSARFALLPAIVLFACGEAGGSVTNPGAGPGDDAGPFEAGGTLDGSPAEGGAVDGSPADGGTMDGSPDAGAQTKWRTGWYGDCFIEMPHGGDTLVAIGNAEYVALKSCMDFYATQSHVTGIFFIVTWASLEGDTPGSYDGSVGNGLAGPGKIGFPLMDDLLAYAASKNLKIILGIDWFNESYGPCGSGYAGWGVEAWVPRYIIQSSLSGCGGTDTTDAYGVYLPSSGGLVTRLWKSAEMDRYMAMLQAYGSRYDNNHAFEMLLPMQQEADMPCPCDGSQDGYTIQGLEAQVARIPGAVKPYWPHTNLLIPLAWVHDVTTILNNGNTTATATGEFENNAFVQSTGSGLSGYLGLTLWGQPGTHDYKGELPHAMWLAGPELCGYHNGEPEKTPQQFYDPVFVNGKDDAVGHPSQPSHYIIAAHGMAATYCPNDPTQSWGPIDGTGWYNFIQSHATSSACPSRYTGGCNTTP